MVRTFSRRLQRLEERVRRANPYLSIMIHFVAPGEGVTSTLLIESGKRGSTALGEAAEQRQPPAKTTADDRTRLASIVNRQE
jgi:hypothetical protein